MKKLFHGVITVHKEAVVRLKSCLFWNYVVLGGEMKLFVLGERNTSYFNYSWVIIQWSWNNVSHTKFLQEGWGLKIQRHLILLGNQILFLSYCGFVVTFFLSI